MRDSPTYKTYLAFATGAATPKNARKFKKPSSPSKKKTFAAVEEPAEKPATRKQSAGVQIRDTLGVSVSKKKAPAKTEKSKGIKFLSDAALHKEAQLKKDIKRSKRETHIHQAGGLIEGVDLVSEVPDEPKCKAIKTSEGTSLKLRVPDNIKAVDINKTDDEEYDKFVHTPKDYVPTDDKDVDDEEFDHISKQMYGDVNVELQDSERKGDQVKDDAHAQQLRLSLLYKRLKFHYKVLLPHPNMPLNFSTLIIFPQILHSSYHPLRVSILVSLDLSKDTKPYTMLRSSRSIQLESISVIKNGNKVLTRTVGTHEETYEPTSVEEKLDRRNEMKARGTLLMALPNKYQLKFHSYQDAKLLIESIEKISSSTNEADTIASGVSTAHTQGTTVNFTSVDNLSDAVICSFLASQLNSPQLAKEDLEQIDPNDLEEIDLHWKMVMLTIRARRFMKRTENALIAQDGIGGYDWSYQAGEEIPINYAFMVLTSSKSSSSSESKVDSCSKSCMKAYGNLKEQYDSLTSNYKKSQYNLLSYKAGLQSVEERLVHYKKNEVVLTDKINVLNLDVKLRAKVLADYTKNLEQAEKERGELKLTLEKLQNSFKALNNLLDSQVSDKSKAGLGYKEITPDSFVNSSKILAKQENIPDKEYHAVPPPLIGNCMPLKHDLRLIDEHFESVSVDVISNITHSDVKTVKTIDVNHKGMFSTEEPNPVMNNNFSPPIIEDWHSDDESEEEISPTIEVKTVKPTIGRLNMLSLFEHLQYVCDKKDIIPMRNNLNRVNKKNFANKLTHPHPKRGFVPRAVLTRSGKINTTGASVTTTARPVNNARSKSPVTHPRIKSKAFQRGHSKDTRSNNKLSANKNSIFNNKVNTVRVDDSTARDTIVVNGNMRRGVNVVKASACWGNPQQKEYKEKGVIDSGCSRNMTRNKCYLNDFEAYDGGFVSFRDEKGRISSKGKIKTGKLDFDDVYSCKELKYNLFSMSQMCDKKNNVLSTNTECHVLSSNFKLLDESQVLLRVPRKDNIYSVDLKSVVPTGGIENQLDFKVKVIRCDNGTKFKNSAMNQFYEDKGIKRDSSIARTPQQNRVAERRNMTLIEAARTMLVDSKLPTTFWAEAVNTACFVLNRALVTKPHNKIPYELIRGRPPLIDFVKPFGCLFTILNTRDNLGKFERKADEGYFVGYSVVRLLFDIDSLTISMNYVPVVAGNQTNGIARSKENLVAGQNDKQKELEQEYILIPICITDPLISQGNKDSAVDVGKKALEVDESESSDNVGKNDQVPRTPINVAGPSARTNAFEEHFFKRFSPFKNAFSLLHVLIVTPIDDTGIFGNAYDDEVLEGHVDINNVVSSYKIPKATKFLKYHPQEQMIGSLETLVHTR
uniref:Ribonuclease H-like domain-containing protein n=1 Tax=Tanacetum cinerariifolium TaxID=118510 RepID=A0A6L2MN13_TANCI|nr:ribonuclease H-like domain-containing protein [Tanacetum cinerariifolium]